MNHNFGMSQGLGMTEPLHTTQLVEVRLGTHKKTRPAEIL